MHFVKFVREPFYRTPEAVARRCSVRNFAKFTGKHLCQSLFFNKVAGLRPQACNFIKTLVQVFSYEFWQISKNTIFTEHMVTASDRSVKRFSYKFHTMHRKTPISEPFSKQNRRMQACNFPKKRSNTGAFSEFCKFFMSTYFTKHLRTAASEIL